MIPEKMIDCINTTANEIKKRDDFVIVGHYDADGLCSAAIIAKALQRENKNFKIKIVKQLYSDTISEIEKLGANFIFVDFGSSQLDIITKNFQENSFIFDHHQSLAIEHPFHVNPFNYGVNASMEISGAGVCYLFAKSLNQKNSDLSTLAIVGAVGDMQDFCGKLIGLNRQIIEDALALGLLKVEIDLRLYGRISRPLIQFLEFSSNPILPQLTGNEKACIRFLEEIKIPLKKNEVWLSYNDLSAEEKKRLVSALIIHLYNHNTPEWKICHLVGETYSLLQEDPRSPLRDAKEFATLLNATGRHNMPEIGLKVAMGDRSAAYQKALSILVEHRKQLKAGIELMVKQGVEERETFFFFDAEKNIKDSIVGIIAGMLYGSAIPDATKPIVVMAHSDDGNIKVSARATADLVYRGINLGRIIKEVCIALGAGAEGGGHSIASGAKIKPEMKEKFLELLNEKLKLKS